MDYEIKCYTRFSWGYVYKKDGRCHEIWADNLESLKRKVLAKGLSWNQSKVPEPKPARVRPTYIGAVSFEGSPAQFRLPWCKSNYKRY